MTDMVMPTPRRSCEELIESLANLQFWVLDVPPADSEPQPSEGTGNPDATAGPDFHGIN